MDFQSLDQGDGILRFDCTGLIVFADMARLVEAVAAASGGVRSLVIIDFRGVEGTFDNFARFRVGELAAEKLRHCRILSLARPKQINKLAENTAVNRGAQVMTTSDEAEGLAWLRESKW